MTTDDVAHQTTETKMNTADVAGSCSSSPCVVRWDRFLPKMAMRVLLVEADDSTRQIITALLRKCSYRVAAVADGLKAWELLKGRPHGIDLILTEVELPLISGYALLTLIMEHDVCKNIPVIMMSTNDSVSMVYKCMLRGAADFLVKPVRKNELRNLWQHVWRKQASNSAAAAGGPGPPDESVAQQKVEVTAENNAVSNQSSGFIECVQRNRECIEKGSDAQSSCTKPELENDEAVADITISDDVHVSRQDLHHQESRETLANDNEGGGLRAVQEKNSHDDAVVRNFSENHHDQVLESSCREAIDLIGAFDANNCSKGVLESPASNDSTNRFDISRQLDLSLRRSHPSSSVNQANEENRMLNHSIASAFSRYINRSFHPGNSTSPSTQNNQNRDYETDSGKQLSNHAPDYNSDTHGPKMNYQIESRKAEIAFSQLNQREVSQPIPVRGVRLENVINGYGSLAPEIYRSVSGSPLPSPGTPNPSKSFPQLNKIYSLVDQRISANDYVDQTRNEQGQHLENDQRGDSGYYAQNTSHYHGTGSGDNANEGGNGEVFNRVHEGSASHSHRSVQREAALTKFRMKRKERCFEKKVRYESRKKLAEQRPRVKGQFVRQVPNDPQSGNSSAG